MKVFRPMERVAQSRNKIKLDTNGNEIFFFNFKSSSITRTKLRTAKIKGKENKRATRKINLRKNNVDVIDSSNVKLFFLLFSVLFVFFFQ